MVETQSVHPYILSLSVSQGDCGKCSRSQAKADWDGITHLSIFYLNNGEKV